MENVLIVHGEQIFFSKIQCFMINMYAPQHDYSKRLFWNIISDFRNQNMVHYVIFGDFNVVRSPSE